MTKGKKVVLTGLVLVVTILLSSFLYVFYTFQAIHIDDENEKKQPYSKDNKNDNDEKADYKEIEGITNILLMGIDDRKTGEPVRSDTIMILTLDDIHKNVKLTSIMRDAYVEIPDYSAQKINHSYAYGGRNLLMRTIENNFDIKLDKYIEINFAGFKDLVDAIDGLDVQINNKEELNELNRCILLEIYEDPKSNLNRVKEITKEADLLWLREEGAPLIKNNPRISRTEYNYLAETAGFIRETGSAHLNGRQLLAYSRMRHVGNGSYERTERQRNVVNMLIDKLKDTSPIKYNSVANKLIPYVKTNMGFKEAIDVAFTAYKINNFNMEQLQIPTDKLSAGRIYRPYGNDKGWVLLMDRQANKNILHDFIFNDIEYDESKYNAFSYVNSEYYYYVPPKEPEKPDEDIEEENIENEEDINNEEDTNNDENSDDENMNNEDINKQIDEEFLNEGETGEEDESSEESSENEKNNGNETNNNENVDNIENTQDEEQKAENNEGIVEEDSLKDENNNQMNKNVENTIENENANEKENLDNSTKNSSDIEKEIEEFLDDNEKDKNIQTEINVE